MFEPGATFLFSGVGVFFIGKGGEELRRGLR
jgi:hypothetical protein